MHEGELGHRHLRNDERIEVGVAHAAIDIVERERQRHPALNQGIEALAAVDVERT